MIRQRRVRLLLAYTVLCLWTLFVGVPLYWLLITALKSGQATSSLAAIPWVDFQPTLNAFYHVLIRRGAVNSVPFINSTIVALSAAVISTVVGSAAGYGLARFPFRAGLFNNERIAFAFLIQRMFPPAVLLIPFLLLYRTLNLLDTRHGLVLAYCAFNIPLVVWIMRDFFRSLPLEVEESAMIDGCSRVGVLFRIALPLATPGFVTCFTLVMISSWNEFLFALTFAFNKTVTVPLILSGTGGGTMSVLALASLLPMIGLGLAFERYFVRGLTLGMVK